jgi:hypothetical protein
MDHIDDEDSQEDHEEKQKNDWSAQPPSDKSARWNVSLSREQNRSADECETLIDQQPHSSGLRIGRRGYIDGIVFRHFQVKSDQQSIAGAFSNQRASSASSAAASNTASASAPVDSAAVSAPSSTTVTAASSAIPTATGNATRNAAAASVDSVPASVRPAAATFVTDGFVWAPHLLMPDLKYTCPHCKGGDGNVTLDGKLRRRVVCADATKFLVYWSLRCTVCERASKLDQQGKKRSFTFNTTNPLVRAALPQHIARLFPFVSTSASNNSPYVETAVVFRWVSALLRGSSIAAQRRGMIEEHERTYTDQAASYLWQQQYARTTSNAAAPAPVLRCPTPQECAAQLYVPSAGYMSRLLIVALETNDTLHTRMMQQVGAFSGVFIRRMLSMTS